MITQLLNILREAIRRVPAMKYAFAVAGLMAVVALVGAFKISPQVAVFGAVVMLVLMVAMVVFARLTTVAPRHFFLPVQVMMWSFLLVTVATALMLFTCAFFQWPKGLRDLISPEPGRRGGDLPRARQLVESARLQLNARDYAGAWRTVREGVGLAPEFNEGREEQLAVAMAWLRDLTVPGDAGFTDTVNPLLQCLYANLAKTSGVRAADLHAHIGWANFLKSRDGASGLRIEEEYQQAAALEPQNPFAHAMWGHWLAFQRRPLKEVNQHFQAALQSGREREFVRTLQLAALEGRRDFESAAELVRLANEIRTAHESLPPGMRRRIFDGLYFSFGREREDEIVALLPPREHLDTLQWLLEEGSSRESAAGRYYSARLTEATGDQARALALYQAIPSDNSSYYRQIKAAIQRCRQGGGPAPAPVVAEPTGGAQSDTATRLQAVRQLASNEVISPAVGDQLVLYLRDENREVRAAASDALVRGGAAVVPQVVTLLASRNKRDVIHGAHLLGRMAQQPSLAVPALATVLQDNDPELGEAAARALAEFGPDAAPALPSLLELLRRTDDVDVQKVVTWALGELGTNAAAAVPLLIDQLNSTGDAEGFLNNNAAEALGKIGPAAAPAVPHLIAALKSEEVRLPTRAADALGRMGSAAASAIPALLDAIKSAEPGHRMNYVEPLGQIAQALSRQGATEALPPLKVALRELEHAQLEPAALLPVREAIDGLREMNTQTVAK